MKVSVEYFPPRPAIPRGQSASRERWEVYAADIDGEDVVLAVVHDYVFLLHILAEVEINYVNGLPYKKGHSLRPE